MILVEHREGNDHLGIGWSPVSHTKTVNISGPVI